MADHTRTKRASGATATTSLGTLQRLCLCGFKRQEGASITLLVLQRLRRVDVGDRSAGIRPATAVIAASTKQTG